MVSKMSIHNTDNKETIEQYHAKLRELDRSDDTRTELESIELRNNIYTNVHKDLTQKAGVLLQEIQEIDSHRKEKVKGRSIVTIREEIRYIYRQAKELQIELLELKRRANAYRVKG